LGLVVFFFLLNNTLFYRRSGGHAGLHMPGCAQYHDDANVSNATQRIGKCAGMEMQEVFHLLVL
jgi:hypothetical protein